MSSYVGELYPISVLLENTDDRSLDLSLSVSIQLGEEDDGEMTEPEQMRNISQAGSSIAYASETSGSVIKNIALGTLQAGSHREEVIHLRSPLIGTQVIDVSLRSNLASDAKATQETTESVSVPVIAPFVAASHVAYLPSNTENLEAAALVTTILSAPGPRDISVSKLTLESSVSSVPVKSVRFTDI